MTSRLGSTRLRAGATTVAALLALSTGCGLKPTATDSLHTTAGAAPAAGNGAGSTGNGSGLSSSQTITTGPAAPSGSTPGGTVANAPTGSGPVSSSTGNTGTSPTGSTKTGSVSRTCTSYGGTSTGVTSKAINIGLHAPLTGTGTPFPNSSFEKGAGTFWAQPGHTVCGKQVNVEFQDDTYTPSGARTVCSAMAKRDFLVVGGGGTDQIQACATDPDIQRLGVPYLSAGVTTNGLTSLRNYFAVSLTYQQQGVLVVRNALAQGFGRPAASRVASDNISGQNAQWAVVTANTKNFDDATQGIDAALTAQHIPYKNFRVSQQDQNQYKAAAGQLGNTLALDGFKTIFVDAAPGYFVFMTGGYYGAGTVTNPNWVGPGVTYTEVTVAQYICSTTHAQINGHAWFLAPAPGIDRATSDFKRAYNNKYDDIEWSLWGLSNTLWHLLRDSSADLTRQNFIASSERAIVPAGVYPPVDYLHHGGHFGGTAAWVQKVNCLKTEPDQNQPGQWDTVGNAYLTLY